MAERSGSCAACLQVRQQLVETAALDAKTVQCPAGLCDTAVPVRLGDRLIGFLFTGQVFLHKPSEAQFNRTARLAADWKIQSEPGAFREAYFSSPVLPRRKHDSVVKLLNIFAQHLAILSNQLVLRREGAELAAVTRAREFIETHYAEELSLAQVARSVNTSEFYFCKLFKKSTGINYTDYLARVRIERAKNLLLNPNLRISEIAFEVGFQSLTHFNRVFKRILGQAPGDYRSQIIGN